MAVLRFLGMVKSTDMAGTIWPLRVFQQGPPIEEQKEAMYYGEKKIITSCGRRVFLLEHGKFFIAGTRIILYADAPELF